MITLYRMAMEAGKTLPAVVWKEFRNDILEECDSASKADELYDFLREEASRANQNILDLIDCCNCIADLDLEVDGFETAKVFLAEVNNSSRVKFADLLEVAMKAAESVEFSTAEIATAAGRTVTEEQLVEELLPQLPAFWGRVAGVYYERNKFVLAYAGFPDELVSFVVDGDTKVALPLYARKALRAYNKAY